MPELTFSPVSTVTSRLRVAVAQQIKFRFTNERGRQEPDGRLGHGLLAPSSWK